MSTTALDDLLWQVREAGTCLLCASGSNCSSPADCLHWASEYIAKANKIVDASPVQVSVFEQGSGALASGVLTAVTEEALLLVALDGGATVTVGSCDVVAS